MYRPGPRRRRPRTCEKSGSSDIRCCAPGSRGRTIGLSTYVWVFGHIALASDAVALSSPNGNALLGEVAWRWGRARGARPLLSSCDPQGSESSYPRFRHAELSAPVPPPAWHELSVEVRQKGDGGTVHASSWVGRHGGEDVSGPSTVSAQRGLLPVL